MGPGGAQEMLEEQERAGARGDDRVRGADLASNHKGRRTKEERLATVLEGGVRHPQRFCSWSLCALHPPPAMSPDPDGALDAGAGREGRQFGAAAGKQPSAAFLALDAACAQHCGAACKLLILRPGQW